MRVQVASTVRLAAFRSRVFSLAKTCSIGEVGAVGWQEEQLCAGGADGTPHRLSVEAAEIVDNDSVAGSERWYQHLFDLAQEGFAVNRLVDHTGSADAVWRSTARKPASPVRVR